MELDSRRSSFVSQQSTNAFVSTEGFSYPVVLCCRLCEHIYVVFLIRLFLFLSHGLFLFLYSLSSFEYSHSLLVPL